MRAYGLSTAIIVGSLAGVMSVSAVGGHGNTHRGDTEFTEVHGTSLEGRAAACHESGLRFETFEA
jgi:hypothetical protein